MLAENETDLAIILTEGMVKSIVEGNPSKIIQEYIASSLLWGIHVAANSEFKTISDLENTKAAISRFGSGSHLMSYLLAQNKNWNLDKLQFEVIDNLEGAITALTQKKADYFMWERFTTKPLVDDGTFRRIEDYLTPWPCFVIAATNNFIEENSNLLEHIIEVINMYTSEFKNIPSIDRTLSNEYGLKLEDINDWLAMTKWSQSKLSKASLEKVQETLFELKLITIKIPSEAILY
jgi:ABC-type nitrate/sulfonate/bicarbonate transport system substrate-binding protein